ncbi:mersacidin/lichenicidin family type 2 lantibiotic [Dictyobacter kobayashii]|uniref:Mersacidin/lichenicidin family type 2 lantibiotic n=1 Tax=Dictyobacter kobayashii TaxID=2014872 RepID=A0A402ASW0_9CHLR|nr:mersacidin/lichenicidin family type 2 lantibiotic [Dictyobacter kobayashii]GCE22206.1 hypothetical protein KDK_60060 [Dictyobacter kobayashii]
MDFKHIIRAWSDPRYRESLSPEEQASMPDHPSGFIAVSDAELSKMVGGGSACDASLGCCPFITTSDPCSAGNTDTVQCGCGTTD